MTIREFKPSDQAGVTRLQEEFMLEFFPEFSSDPRQYEWNADIYDIDEYYLKHCGKFWVAEDAGEIVGVGGFRLVSPTIAEIKRVRIQAHHRGKGLGKAIISIIEEYCRAQHITKILVDTDERLAAAKSMYVKLGYTVCRTETVAEGDETYVNYYFEKVLHSGDGK